MTRAARNAALKAVFNAFIAAVEEAIAAGDQDIEAVGVFTLRNGGTCSAVFAGCDCDGCRANIALAAAIMAGQAEERRIQ